jgi:CRP-like cAMP-binding protein
VLRAGENVRSDSNGREVPKVELLSEHEKQLDRYLQENKKDEAIQLLHDLIVDSAREKNFDRAEALRDKLYEVDPLAITEIVKTGEVIEAEKRSAIDKDHLELWADFYESLTAEETNTLFYGMQQVDFEKDHMVFKQGEICSRIYFIDKGRLKMIYRLGDQTIALKTLGPGDIVGEDTFFFSDAFCTTSVITDSAVRMRVLDKDDLAILNEKSPALESKIIDYCLKLESVCNLLKARKLERRVNRRISLPGKILVRILKEGDDPEDNTFHGELLDISASGMAFIIKTTRKFAKLLLGRNLELKLTFDEIGSDMHVDAEGTVVAVNREPFSEYIVHTDFGRDLKRSVIDDLEDLRTTLIKPIRR